VLVFVSCNEDKSTGPEDEIIQQGVESELKIMDETVAQMGSSPMVFALLQFQGISTNFFGETSFPLAPQLLFNNDLKKLYPGFNDVKIDTNLVAAFVVLEALEGTHTYNDEDSSWTSTDSPEDAVIFIFSFQGIDGNHAAQITINNISLSNTIAGLNMIFAIDGSTAMTLSLQISGSNFTMPGAESSMTKVELSGSLAAANGLSMGYSITVTETSAIVSMGPTGASLMTITVEGNGILSSGLPDENDDGAVINSITMAYGANLEIVVTDTDAESGKVGDVYYQGEDVGDVVSEDDELYIKYSSGTKVLLSELMPNTFSMISLFGEISG
jgi:hypothetical protein